MWNFQVPVIAVFTKQDQFKREIKMKLEDQLEDRDGDVPALHDAEVERIFNQHYLARLTHLTGPPPFIRLESEGLHDHSNMN